MAEDGLGLLNYLGITNLTNKEIEVFREEWNGVYSMRNKSLVSATWTLYSQVLPFKCEDSFSPRTVSQIRDSDFGDRLKATEFDKELKSGIALEDILKKGPHKFYRST